MAKAFYRSDYCLGYRLSNGTQDLSFSVKPHNENYYALALCVYENYPSGKALYAMGISPERETSYEVIDATYKQLGGLAYILNKVCGVQQKEAAPMLKVSKTTFRKAVDYARREFVVSPKTKLEPECSTT